MAHCYDFAIVRLAPQGARGEALNIGVVVFDNDRLDVRASARLEKLRALSTAINPVYMQQIIDNLPTLDEKARDAGLTSVEDRANFLSQLGPITLSSVGQFIASDTSAYEFRINSIMKAMVAPETAVRKPQFKRSRLLTQMKLEFRTQRVLAKKEDDLSAHRVMSRFTLDEGLVADLVLKNGKYNVIETVDASSDDDTARRAISDIGVSALVLERARMRFGAAQTKARLVYSASSALEKVLIPSLDAAMHQGAELVNWSSRDDRRKVINTIASLATPIPEKKSSRSVLSLE